MKAKFSFLESQYKKKEITYDKLYDFIEGWIAYAKHAKTHKLRKNILADFENRFLGEISAKDIDKYFKMQRQSSISV